MVILRLDEVGFTVLIDKSSQLIFPCLSCALLIDLDMVFSRFLFQIMQLSTTYLYVVLVQYLYKLFAFSHMVIFRSYVLGFTVLIDGFYQLIFPCLSIAMGDIASKRGLFPHNNWSHQFQPIPLV